MTPPTVTVSVEAYCVYRDIVSVTAVVTPGTGTINPSTGYTWSFAAKPAGSTATFTGQGTANASFIADAEGSFTPQCIVTASDATSSPATASVISNAAIHVVINGVLRPATIDAIVH